MARTLMLYLALSWLSNSFHWANVFAADISFSSVRLDDAGPIKRAEKYWLEELGGEGKMPLAPDGDKYKFFRNVKDYGAKGDGKTDDTAAINRAASEGNRCGQGCAGTSTTGALVYFPPGTYLVKEPIVQYYYTQFVGDPNDRPVLKADRDFKGIAIFDTDPYIPGGNSAQWYINQNQFFRQIRNFVLDMRDMKEMNYDETGQGHVPVGIHWQVAQATSLQNIKIQMRDDGKESAKTSIGIFTENGSGGFVSDLEFSGGFIGYQIGSQQFTIRNLKFYKVQSAIQVTWNWGMTWQQITIDNCVIGFNVTGKTPDESGNGQGVGSLAIIDSTFKDTNYGVGLMALNGAEPPELVLDNILVSKTSITVGVNEEHGKVYLEGSGSSDDKTIKSWALGTRYESHEGKHNITHGLIDPAPNKPSKLIDDDGKYFVRGKPDYGNIKSDRWVVATDHGINNDGSGDQTDAINRMLRSNNPLMSPIAKKYVYFPAGIYQVLGTIHIPIGTVVVGSGWSNIRATGSFFSDKNHPKPVVQVGEPGDMGVIEISDMMFTVKGATAGAVLMEWNVKEFLQGSAAMWDSHFRIGGAVGTDLSLTDCPRTGGLQDKCIAASMLLHITEQSSGYFENVWAWTADHDIDAPLGDATNSVSTSVNIFTGRGVLIESKGPTWLYGTASEHHVLYQYELSGAENIYMGHFQTETPYYQPVPNALQPFPIGKFSADPEFKDCTTDTCKEAWGLRIMDSKNVFIYSAGMYSFFNNYGQVCLDPENCQERLFRIERSNHVWAFNIFTKGTSEVISGFGEIPSVPFNFTAKSGFTSEIGAYLPFAGNGSMTNATVVYVDPEIWRDESPDVYCDPPCIMVLPPSTLKSATTVTFPPLTTTLELGWTTTVDGAAKFTSSVETTTIKIPAVTTSVIKFWNYNITSTSKGSSNDSFVIFPFTSLQPPPFTITQTYPPGVSVPKSIRTILPPPWPYSSSSMATHTSSLPSTTSSGRPTLPYFTTQPQNTIYPVTTFVEKPTATNINGKIEPVVPCHAWFIFSCPPNVRGWRLSGWDTGIYPPGPPPRPGPLPVIPDRPEPPTLTLPPIPWPEITIGPDHVPTYPPHDPNEVSCETKEAELCGTTISIGTVQRRRSLHGRSLLMSSLTAVPQINGRQERPPSTTTTISTCLKVAGCHVRDHEFTTTSTPEATPEPHPWVIYPSDPMSAGNLERALQILPAPFHKSQSDSLGTIFFFVYDLSTDKANELRSRSEELKIQDIYVPHGKLTQLSRPFINPAGEPNPNLGESDVLLNSKTGLKSAAERVALQKRAQHRDNNADFELAAISWAEGQPGPLHDQTYYYEESPGADTFLYLVDWGAVVSHPEFSHLSPRPSPIRTYPFPIRDVGDNDEPGENSEGYHGTCMMAKMAGRTVGIARNATVIYTVINYEKSVYEHFLDGLMRVHDDIKKHEGEGRAKKSVVNLSLNFQTFEQAFNAPDTLLSNSVSAGFTDKMAYIIEALIKMGVVVTTGSGNRGNAPIDGYPAKFKDPADRNHIPDLIVVGSVEHFDKLPDTSSQVSDYIDIWAPGHKVRCTDPQAGEGAYRRTATGTSVSSALVAGLAAYLRGLNPELASAREVSDLIKTLGWTRPATDAGAIYKKMIWNGQTNGRPSPCIGGTNNRKRQDSGVGEACVLPGSGGLGKPLTFSPGATSPTCTANCGNYCTGFFCSAPCSTKCGPPPDNPTQTVNPDFFDPGNPNSCQNKKNPSFGNCDGSAPVASPCTTTTISGTVACYTSPTSTSTPTPTPTPSPTPPPPPPPPPPPADPVTPLELKPRECNDEEDFPGHGDVNPDSQWGKAGAFCQYKTMDDNTYDLGPGEGLGDGSRDGHGIDYYFEVKWIDGCKTTVDRQDIESPVGGDKTCKDLLRDVYRTCNNGGVGGWIDAGCLRYSFVGAKRPG